MDYTKYRELSKRLVSKYGRDGKVIKRQLVKDPAKPWLTTETVTETNVKLIQFDDDGVTFVNHNITGHVKILIIAPVAGFEELAVGDTITYGIRSVTVQKYKKLDPDDTGAILWAVLVQ